MTDPKPKANPKIFKSGLEAMRHYIPDYEPEKRELTTEEKAEQAAARIMSEAEVKLDELLEQVRTISDKEQREV